MRTRSKTDPTEIVHSVLPDHSYHCPDLPAVDEHLSTLSRDIGPAAKTTSRRKRATWADIDRLLDRRLYLALVA
jgi:hypothetical protein